MTQASTNSTFHRQTNQVELARPVDANSVEFIPTALPPDLTSNARRIWIDRIAETLNFTVDGVNIHTVLDSLNLGIVSVKWFGAVGNGIHDDTAAIQAAINNTNGIQTIVFPQGQYLVSSQVTASNKELQLIGLGGATIVEVTPHLTQAIFQFTNCSNTTVTNLSCAGSETLAGFAGSTLNTFSFMTFTTSNNVIVSGCSITNKTYGVIFQDCNNCSVSNMDIVGFLVTGSLAINGANFSSGVFITGGKNNTFTHSHVKDMGSGCLVGTGNTSPNYHVINQIWMENMRDNGIYISSGDNCTVSNVSVDSAVNNAGVKARGSYHSIFGCNIKNTFSGITLTGNGTTPDPLGFNGHGTRCFKNSMDTCSTLGISLEGQDGFFPRDFIVDGNVLTNCGDNDPNHAAIRMFQGQGHIITNNIIDGSLSPYCILIQGLSAVSRSKFINVSNNMIRNGVQGIRSTFIDTATIVNNEFDLLSVLGIECRFTTNSNISGNKYVTGQILSITAGNTNVANVITDNIGVNYGVDLSGNYVTNNVPYASNFLTSIAGTPYFRGQIAIVGSSVIHMAANNTAAGDWKQISN